MRYVHNRFKTDYFTFWDETFTINKDRLKDFVLNTAYRQMRCDTRRDSITDEMVGMMKSSGCGQISIGLECANNEILKLIGKNETTDDFKRASDILARHKIQWKAYMIIGFPYDTEETILESVKFVKELNPFRITLSFFTPYKGTQLYDESKKLGLINENYDLSLFSHQSPHNYFCPRLKKTYICNSEKW